MQLDHERLDVYDLALQFLVLANGIIEGLPRGRSHLADQFTRASLSIVLNWAEGAGRLPLPWPRAAKRARTFGRGGGTRRRQSRRAWCGVGNPFGLELRYEPAAASRVPWPETMSQPFWFR